MFTWMSIFLLAVAMASGQTNKPLTADDLVQMKKAGLDEQTLVKAIEANGTAVDTSGQGLVALKNAGLGDTVIRAVLSAGSSPSAASPRATTSSPIPEEVGAYLLQGDALTLLPVEIARTKTGGMFKSMATLGASRMNVSGSVSGAKSSMRLKAPVNIVLRCSEGTTPAEYQLLILEPRKDRRDFTTGKVGLFRASTGVDDKNIVPTKFERIGPGTYKTTLTDLNNGEYGIFVAGPIGPGSPGKLYTFGVD